VAAEPPLDEVVRVAALRASLRRFLRRSEQVARGAGLTPQRYLLLLMVKGSPDSRQRATISQLAERLQLAQSTVTELVTRAEQAGLVRRSPSADDARSAHVTLTPEGERRLAEAFAGLEGERRAILSALVDLGPPASGP
jgi:DNA-binding MarR family transcriptional regulator